MSILLSILLWILAIAGSLLLIVLLVPFQARARGAFQDGRPDGLVVLRWGWGFVGVRMSPGDGITLHLAGLRVHRFEPGGEREEKKPKKKKDKGRGLGWSLRNRSVLSHLFRRFVGLLHIRGTVRGEVGLDDPADTAWLSMLAGLATARIRGLTLALRFDFTGEVLRIHGKVSAWLWPAQVAVVAVGLLFRRDVRRALRATA